jgi:hypothetical protein
MKNHRFQSLCIITRQSLARRISAASALIQVAFVNTPYLHPLKQRPFLWDFFVFQVIYFRQGQPGLCGIRRDRYCVLPF